MKAVYRYSIAFVATVLAVCLLVVLSTLSREQKTLLTCTGLEVEIMDSTSLSFVSKADVKRYIERDYGVYMGQRLDSVDLKKIETVLDGRSAILKSEAYTTTDGILHVEVTQREPVVRFQKGERSEKPAREENGEKPERQNQRRRRNPRPDQESRGTDFAGDNEEKTASKKHKRYRPRPKTEGRPQGNEKPDGSGSV